MRIGTWNLAGRWDDRHRALLEMMDCDVLLLTEVSERLAVPGYDLHLGRQLMAPKRRWAAVASRLPGSPEPDPHGASAMVALEGLRVCSSILPWRSCGTRAPWGVPQVLRGPAPLLRRSKPVHPRSGAEIGTTPSRARSGQARSRAGSLCSRLSNV